MMLETSLSCIFLFCGLFLCCLSQLFFFFFLAFFPTAQRLLPWYPAHFTGAMLSVLHIGHFCKPDCWSLFWFKVLLKINPDVVGPLWRSLLLKFCIIQIFIWGCRWETEHHHTQHKHGRLVFEMVDNYFSSLTLTRLNKTNKQTHKMDMRQARDNSGMKIPEQESNSQLQNGLIN